MIAKIKTGAKTVKGLATALYKDDPLWFYDCKTSARRITATEAWLKSGLEWNVGKNFIVRAYR